MGFETVMGCHGYRRMLWVRSHSHMVNESLCRWLRRLAIEQQSPFLWCWRLVCRSTVTQKGFDWFVHCLLDHFEPLEDICKYLRIFLLPCAIVLGVFCTFGALLLLILIQYYSALLNCDKETRPGCLFLFSNLLMVDVCMLVKWLLGNIMSYRLCSQSFCSLIFSHFISVVIFYH